MIGHQWAVDLLADHVAYRRERHAYLITGPQGIGRRTLALRFAQSLNCPNPSLPGQPCLQCVSCRRFASMQHPDLSLVAAENVGEVLKIDQVRELLHTLSLSPYEAKYRLALILRFEEANTSASNAILKTLEEPPPPVVLILTANSVENLLPTIVSRCEVIRLRPLSLEATAQGLQAVKGMPADTAIQLAHISAGRPGYAIRLYQQPELLEQRQSWVEGLFHTLAGSRRERFASAIELVRNHDELRSMLQVWLTLWRDVLLRSTGITDSLTNPDYLSQLERLAQQVTLRDARLYARSIESTLNRIDHNVNARLALEVLLIDFPRVNVIE